MEIIPVEGNEQLVQNAIKKRGHTAEHNFYCYLYNCEGGTIPYFFKFSDDEGILAYYDEKNMEWMTFAGVLAAEKNRIPCLMAFLDCVFGKHAKNVCVEYEEGFRKQILSALKKNGKYRAVRPNCILEWPVFKMSEWTGDKMEGKDWKYLRNCWNRFFAEHEVEFKTAAECDKTEMKKLVLEWKKQRTTGDRTHCDYYLNAVEGGFQSYDHTRAIFVDGKMVAITAGFKVPNKNYYYSSIGLYTREFDHIGEVANMDDLKLLKEKGFELVDFGGGEESLTVFKKKFKPDHFYKTLYFSIKKKDKEK